MNSRILLWVSFLYIPSSSSFLILKSTILRPQNLEIGGPQRIKMTHRNSWLTEPKHDDFPVRKLVVFQIVHPQSAVVAQTTVSISYLNGFVMVFLPMFTLETRFFWEISTNSLTWILRPFIKGDDFHGFPYKNPWFPGLGRRAPSWFWGGDRGDQGGRQNQGAFVQHRAYRRDPSHSPQGGIGERNSWVVRQQNLKHHEICRWSFLVIPDFCWHLPSILQRRNLAMNGSVLRWCVSKKMLVRTVYHMKRLISKYQNMLIQSP